MRRFDPDTVITFGADGGYSHPDDVAISELTTEAFRLLVRDHNREQRLYHAAFPPRRTCMALWPSRRRYAGLGRRLGGLSPLARAG
jgi:LmbE family N-acetylglucosaminyl deacetylase